MMKRILRGATFVLLAAAALDATAASCPATTVGPATSLPGATVGVNYSQTFTASNLNALPFTFAVTSGLPAGSGLAFTGASLTGSPALTGSYVITVSATDSSGCTGGRTYALAIAQGAQTISFTSTAPAAATVGGAPYAVAASASSGLPVALAIAPASSAVCALAGGNVTFQSAGTCTINANQAGNANYAAAPQVQQSFAVGPGAQTITFTSTAPANAVINGPTYAAAATSTSGLPVTLSIDASASAVCSIAGSTVSFTAAGTCIVNANQAGNANYAAAPQVQQSFAVSRIDQTIAFTSTAPAGAAYGGPTYEVAATASSGLPVAFAVDAASASVCSIAGTTVSFIGAGTCTINATQAGDATYNAAPPVQQSFAVAKADQAITFTSTAPTGASVGGATYTVTATATSGLAVTFTVDPSASAVCSIAGSVVSFTGAGTCVIDANQPGDANWNAAPQVQQSFAVSSCITLALGEVRNLPAGGSTFCVANAAGIDTEYTYVPMSFETASDLTLSLTATGIQAVTGPPSPRPGDAGLALAPLHEASSTNEIVDAHALVPRLGSPFPAERGYDLSDLVPVPQGGTTPLVVGQLIDLNASVGGCGAPTSIRKGRVEAVTTAQSAGQPLLFAVQEVVENVPGSGVWVPAVAAGAFVAADFQAIIDSFAQNPPGNTGNGSGTLGSLLKTGGMDISRANFGTVSDVDNNGGVILFFTPAMNALSPPASSLVAFGLFQPRDLFSAASCPGSNEHEMLYFMVPDTTGVVNSNVRTQSFVFGNAGPQLTHHYEHLVNASRRLYFNGAAPFEQAWLDEGLAWEMQELSFFSASVGLAPRQNVQLSDLTTGPNASRRVAAFNQYQNPMFGYWRGYLYQLGSTNANRRAGPLRQIPYSTSVIPDAHENVAPPATSTQIFLRYALDRANSGDAALLNALVNTNNVGLANLTAVFGASLQDWARDFVVSLYTDDAVTTTPAYTNPSWNYRSVFGGLGGFPLAVNPLTDNVALPFDLGPGGGSRFARFGIATGGSANVTLTQGGNPPASTVTSAIVRTK